MAGASMNDIKARIKSVSSTMQITKAMELVATSKLRRAKEKVERSRPFSRILREAIDNVLSSNEIKDSPYHRIAPSKKTLFIVIAGDRGLAGGYNANVFRLAATLSKESEAIFLPIGKKALEYYRHRKANLFSSLYEYVTDVSVGKSLDIAEEICRAFSTGEFDRVMLVYTNFVSMISQVPAAEQILPLAVEESEGEGFASADPIWGGDPEEILEKIIPTYIGGLINSAILEASASESGSRRTAMNAANKNASEMIDSLMLRYNRARQAVITQEITEIVSGSEAL